MALFSIPLSLPCVKPPSAVPTKNETSITSPQNLALDQKFVISGGQQLSGRVEVSGSKNSALAVLAGTLCCSAGPSLIRGVPDLADTRTMADVLRSLGAKVEEMGDGDLMVDSREVGSVEPCEDAMGKIRAGFFVLGPLVARFGEAEVSLPVVSIRRLRDGKVYVRAANGRGLVGAHFHLSFPSVGATETLMMAACMAEGVSVLTNAAQEPEVSDLAEYLVSCGACIEGAGTSKIVVTGRKHLHGSEFTIIPDRIEAGTFMIAAAITRSSITLSPVIPRHLQSLMDKLAIAGCKITQRGSRILEVSAMPSRTGGDLQGFDLVTLPYPGFATDLQPQCISLLATCCGKSNIEESVFENRMHHVKELQKLGALIELNGNSASIEGRTPWNMALRGCRVEAADLRGGAALVLAGMAAEGATEVGGVTHIDRGYQALETKLQSLGANIKREVDSIHQSPLPVAH
ncbi:hypothetical protein J5N97_004375 [Dioscorea zingiberensis]|uniref:UDP-N-acetylglucosamine 1-carboxyvinyltransferase n=1 Tax=Dioscorea zingiberensis TaxID=325984 RepID=A0A9D5D7S4_9LILI|nr:hypothetical protein J5N97_004375 [Dioscorea zingiberensis]